MKHKGYFLVFGSFFLIFFILLSYNVYTAPHRLTPMDNTITAIIREPYPKLNQFFIWYTQVANSIVLTILTIVTALIFFKKKLLVEAIWLIINVCCIAGILNYGLKHFFMRQRPDLLHLVTEHSYSFPSGHSIGSMVFYGTLLFLLPQFVKQAKRCFLLQSLLGLSILLIGISRIYLGVHFPSDVLGGFSLGLSWLLFTYPIYLNYQSKNAFLLNNIKKHYFK